VHHLQAEAGLVTGAELVSILREFHRDKLALRQRHAAVARSVADYDFNNTYQYVINREDVHLSWLESAIRELQGTPDDLAEPQIQSPARKDKDAYLPLVADDARTAGEFVARWRPRVPDVSNARHRSMMGVVLGETLEQKRFFDLMTAGREDLLGRRANGPGSPGTGDGVLPVRWIE
jgi:hypothetical protein